MTLFRNCPGDACLWFDNAGNPINPDGSPRAGPTIWDLGGPDGTYPDPSFDPNAPPPAPPPPPPPIVPPPQPTSGLYVFAVTNDMLQPAGGLLVTISRDVGSGTTRVTDNSGLASFVVPAGVQLDWTVTGGAYQPAAGSAFIGASGRTEAVVMFPIGPPPPIPIGPQPAHLRVTVHDATTGAPIPGASVSTNDGTGDPVDHIADATGFVDALVALGVVSLLLRAAGYVDSSLLVTVAASMDLAPVLVPVTVTPPPTGGGGGGSGGGTGGGGGGTPPPGGTVPIDDSGARPPAFSVPPVEFDTVGGVRSIRSVSLSALDVPTFGNAPGGLIGLIVGGIVALFGGGGSGADLTKISFRLDKLGALALDLAQTLETFTARATHVDTQGSNLFDRIVGSVLGPIINALAALIKGGSADLGKLFGPISDALKKLLDKVRHLYNTWLKPILHAIDITRQILRVLAGLGLTFAAELDRALGRLEGKITAPVLLLTSKINELRNTVNKIVTINGTLQRVTLLQSMVKHAGCTQRIWWNTQLKGLSKSEAATLASQSVVRDDPHAMSSQLDEYFSGEGSQLGAFADELVPSWREAAGLQAFDERA